MQQFGPGPCIEGRTWGTGPDRDSIWVSRGCSAVFEVTPPGGNDNYAHNGNPAVRSPEWQRGFDDGRRGIAADQYDTAQDYLEGYRAGQDTARDASRYGAQPPRAPSDNSGVFEPAPPPAQSMPPDQRSAPPGAMQNAPQPYGNAPQPYAGSPPPPPPDDRYPPPPPGYRDMPPPGTPPGAPYGAPHDQRYASVDQMRDGARRACIDAAARDRRFGADRIISREVRWIGHNEFAVSLDTPEGLLICMVDRDGNVQSIENR
jgi:hypothetical protein